MVTQGTRANIAYSYFKLAEANYCQGHLDQTTLYYTACLFFNPNYTDGYLELGICYDELGMYSDAVDDDSRLIELNPGYFPAYNNRALALVHLGKQLDVALKDANRALDLDPKEYQLYDTRGDVYRKMKKNDLAIGDYKKALELCNKIGKPTYEDALAMNQIRNKIDGLH